MDNEMPDEIYILHNAGDAGEHLWCDHIPNSECVFTKYVRADKAVPEWQPIESAPKDGTHILAWNYESRFNLPPYICWFGQDIICWFGQDMNEHDENKREWLTGDGDDWSTGYYYTPCKPTHWMPLPQTPKEIR